MTEQEAAGLVAIAIAAYDQAIGDVPSLISAWHMALDDVPRDNAATALREHIRESQWFPKPADIRRRVVAGSNAIPDPYDAWEIVLRHIRENSYINPGPFVAPDPVVSAVRSIGGIAAIRRAEHMDRQREAFLAAYQTYAARAARDMDVVLAYAAVPALETGK